MAEFPPTRHQPRRSLQHDGNREGKRTRGPVRQADQERGRRTRRRWLLRAADPANVTGCAAAITTVMEVMPGARNHARGMYADDRYARSSLPGPAASPVLSKRHARSIARSWHKVRPFTRRSTGKISI